MSWFKIVDDQVELRIWVKPHAKCSALLKVNDQGLHIALHAKPQQGEANKELIAYLAKLFKIPKTHIILFRGEHSRCKVVIVPFEKHMQHFLFSPHDFIL